MDPEPHPLYVFVENLFKQGDERVSSCYYSKTDENFYIMIVRQGNNGTLSRFAVGIQGVSGVNLGAKSPIKLPYPNHLMDPSRLKKKILTEEEFGFLQKMRSDLILEYLRQQQAAP